MKKDARGGYQQPSGGPRASGVGAGARRSDTQAARVPNFSDSEDMQFGDKTRMLEGLKKIPIAKEGQTRFRRGQGAPAMGSRGAAGERAAGGLPPQLLAPSNRPGEPLTEGSPIGPGAGPEVLPTTAPPDLRQLGMEWFVDNFANPDALDMLNEYIEGQVTAELPMPMTSPAGVPPPSLEEEPLGIPEPGAEREEEAPMPETEDEPVAEEEVPPEEVL